MANGTVTTLVESEVSSRQFQLPGFALESFAKSLDRGQARLATLTAATGLRGAEVDEASSVDPGFLAPRSCGPLCAPTVYVARTSVCVNFNDLETPWPPHLTYPSVRT